jgi:cytochrome c oxidase subunit 2
MDTGKIMLMPPKASSLAGEVDSLYFFLVAVTAFFTLLIFVMILYLGLKYRRRRGIVPQPVKTSWSLELAWTIIPLLLTMVMFAWGAALYVKLEVPPKGAMEINVVGKQWMWKIQHPEGKREINELHVPLARTIKLVMSSQDVIHSFYVPAFRVKQDVLPGRFTTLWFQANKTGEYHLFCAEYCGDQHSGMIGTVYVMSPDDYEAWLSGTPADTAPTVAGEKLFYQYACNTCHGIRGPTLAGVYGAPRQVHVDGQLKTVQADEEYIRESILDPRAKIVVGFPPLMPTYAGQLTEEQVMDLVAYIKTLKNASAGPETPPGAPSAPSGGGQPR